MIRKIENAAAFVLVAVLAVLPIAFKICQDGLHVQIPDADLAMVNIVFLFSCLAGLITWRENKHLSLASISDKAPEQVKKVLTAVRSGVSAAVLTAVFLDSLCQLLNPEQLGNTVFGIPLKLFYVFLPLCYFCILFVALRKGDNLLALVLGIIIGILVSLGPVTGMMYYVAGTENVPVLSSMNTVWLSLSQKAAAPLIIFMVLMAFTGVPLFVIIGGISYIAFSQAGGYVDVIPLETYRILTDKSVAAIPLFTIAGYILAQGSAGKRFVAVFKSMFGWFRGGTVVAAVIVMAFFTTFTGVSGVTILALGSLLSIILTGSGYTQDKAESLITSCGALGLLFPPSVAIIMYATTNYFSVDVMDLFKGAVLPGCLMSIAMIATGIVFDRQKVRPAFSAGAIAAALKDCIWELLLPVLICLAYFSGFFDLFQTASFAVLYTFCLSTFVRRDFTPAGTYKVITESIPVSGGVLFILGAASGLSYFMLDADIPGAFASFIAQYVTNKYVFLILMNILLLIIGCLMDIYSAILIVSPLLLPIADSFGVSAVQAGVIFLMNLSIGFLTPPVGMDLFIASYTFKKPIAKVVKGILPFIAVQFAVLMLVTYVPWFTTVLVK